MYWNFRCNIELHFFTVFHNKEKWRICISFFHIFMANVFNSLSGQCKCSIVLPKPRPSSQHHKILAQGVCELDSICYKRVFDWKKIIIDNHHYIRCSFARSLHPPKEKHEWVYVRARMHISPAEKFIHLAPKSLWSTAGKYIALSKIHHPSLQKGRTKQQNSRNSHEVCVTNLHVKISF